MMQMTDYNNISRKVSKVRAMQIASETQLRDDVYICPHCKKRYVKESAFLKHSCKEKERADEIQTPIGQAALQFYSEWLRHLHRKSKVSADMFTKSKFYTTFINFAKFVKQVTLPTPNKFIKFATNKDYPPTSWINNYVYVDYLDYLDSVADPLEQTTDSVKFLLSYCDKHNIDPSEFFNVVDVSDLIMMIQKRQLYPWLLIMSDKFSAMLEYHATYEQKIIIEGLIRADYWVKKLESHPTKVPILIQYVEELGL